ncbi:hydroxyisourate hydrolase [Halalkalibacter kiskunsagensis]|uniref:5-hydroxyisourate hydrolase n=1 Tax=Halalkalibacter kiskunsagensis TaxID=1548599 RepID=A0ABV6KCT1_9BACI
MSGKITTHVLDISTGRPAVNVVIELWRMKETNQLEKVKESRTNDDGRVTKPLLEDNEMQVGTYQIQFHVGDYYRENNLNQDPQFLEVVPVQFLVSNEREHYHVPLLIAPGGYSTYRGS